MTLLATPDSAKKQRVASYTVWYAGTFLGTFTFGAANLILPSVSAEFNANGAEQSFILSSYSTLLAAILIFAGRLGDRFGRRRLFGLGLLLFAAASLAAAFSDSATFLIASRAAQGIGVGLLMPQILSTIQATSSGALRTRALAVFGAVSGLGTVAGQMVSGGVLSLNLFGQGWRPVMWLSAILALLIFAALRSAQATSSAAPLAMDGLGSVLLGFALASFVISMTLFSTGSVLWLAVTLLLGSALLGVLFARWELRLARAGKIPLAPPSLFKVPALRMGLAMNLLFYTGYGAFMFEFSSLTQRGMRYSGLSSGLAIVLFALAFVVTSFYLHRVTARLGKHTMLVGASAQIIALITLGVELMIEGLGVQQWHLQVALVLLGASQALMFGPLVQTVMSQIPSWAAGLSGGLFSTAQQLSFSLGVAVLGGVYFTLSQLEEIGFSGGFAVCMGIQAVAAAVFGVLAWRLHRPTNRAATS